MNFLSLIEAKREGKTLAPEQIQEFIREFTAGKIPDYQMAAMLALWPPKPNELLMMTFTFNSRAVFGT